MNMDTDNIVLTLFDVRQSSFLICEQFFSINENFFWEKGLNSN